MVDFWAGYLPGHRVFQAGVSFLLKRYAKRGGKKRILLVLFARTDVRMGRWMTAQYVRVSETSFTRVSVSAISENAYGWFPKG